MASTEKCPLCKRELGTIRISNHHLIPKSRGGRETDMMHNICHRKLHSLLTNKELELEYNSVERLLEHSEIQKFVKWVAKRPIDYYSGSDETNVRHGKR